MSSDVDFKYACFGRFGHSMLAAQGLQQLDDNLSKLHDFTLHRLLVEAKFPKHEFIMYAYEGG